MNRTFSTAAVLGMTFFALAICLRKTLAISEGLGDRLTTVLILAQVLFGLALLASCAMLIRKRYGDKRLSAQDASKLFSSYAGCSQPFGLRAFAALDRDR